MEVKPGYKQTEVGPIPEDWDAVRIAEVADLQVGFAFKSEWFGEDVGTRLLRGENVGYGRADWSETRTLQTRPDSAYSVYTLNPGDVVIGMDRTFTKTGSKLTLLGDDDCPCLLVQRVGRFIPRKCENNFLWFVLTSEQVLARLRLEQKGMDIPHLSRTEILYPMAAFPPKVEQCAIAKTLSDVDVLLSGLDRLMAKKRDLKQAAMQQLLTGQTRLPGFKEEWEVKRLGDHVTFLRNGVNSRAELQREGPVKYLHYGDVHASKDVFMSPNSLPSLPVKKAASLGRLRDGDLIFADASEDVVGVSKSVEVRGVGNTEIVSGLHTIAARFDKAVLADGFKGYLQHCSLFAAQLRRLAAGTKVYATNRAHIASVEMRLPTPEEQAAIAAVLSDMDTEIASLERRCEKTRALKQAMMQELLTGRTRLVRPEAVHA